MKTHTNTRTSDKTPSEYHNASLKNTAAIKSSFASNLGTELSEEDDTDSVIVVGSNAGLVSGTIAVNRAHSNYNQIMH